MDSYEETIERRGRERRILRIRAGMTQAELAAASGANLSTILRAEQGKAIREESARKLAAALGCGISEYALSDLVLQRVAS